jgi:hypothetical protein
MPVITGHLSIAARGIRAFLNLEAGITRVVEGSGLQGQQRQAAQSGKSARGRPQPAGGQVSRSSAKDVGGVVNPENIIWIFGSGRSGSTWLSSMMEDIGGQTLWGEPWVGTLFGNFYYEQGEGRHNNPQFILGSHKESWIGSIRTFVLNAAAATFPNLN